MSEQPPPHIARLIPRLELTGTERILELGAAPGVAVAEIGPLLTGDGHVTALDRSAVGVRRIRERNQALVDAGRLTVVEQDLTTLAPEPPEQYDLIFASNVNVFWTHPRKANLDALAALLKPGGRLRLFYGYGPGDVAGRGRDTGSLVAATLSAGDALTAVTVDGAGAPLEISAVRR
ncbi:class I SAM-dependent methyltransferase [Jiangella rhizosphaerae]|uniref:Class I SAM-dependent methyltransferase n=1 Tax=Jiangella rhizosphaerae TaxID=2293569 RepID=A0A418KK45_9ACTN|nr:class I SAM-dependent methyltransferase [Jiangella rhizosphaerae]RIQ16037.1 class I SAM-dependent methyltransferase [Jiangella rhizosphaerae]